MRKTELALSGVGVIIALIALIPAFGQWLFPRGLDFEVKPSSFTETEPSPVPASSAVPLAATSGAYSISTSAELESARAVPSSVIGYPEDGAVVGKLVRVRGSISGINPGQRAFLCIKSTAFGRLVFPQGEILPGAGGAWSAMGIYASVGYKYETFVVMASTQDAARMLGDSYNRSYGMPSLPEGSAIVGSIVTVERQ